MHLESSFTNHARAPARPQQHLSHKVFTPQAPVSPAHAPFLAAHTANEGASEEKAPKTVHQAYTWTPLARTKGARAPSERVHVHARSASLARTTGARPRAPRHARITGARPHGNPVLPPALVWRAGRPLSNRQSPTRRRPSCSCASLPRGRSSGPSSLAWSRPPSRRSSPATPRHRACPPPRRSSFPAPPCRS